MGGKVSCINENVISDISPGLVKVQALDRWKQAFDASLDFISILDKEHRVIAINRAMANALNCSPEEAEGRHCCQLVHGKDHPPLGCPHHALLGDGQPHQAEIYDEGMGIWMLINVTPLHDDAGTLIGSIHQSRDISRLKEIEQALRESQDRFHHLSEATMEGVLLSQGGTILVTNQVLAKMLGSDLDEIEGSYLRSFVASSDQDRLSKFLKNDHEGPQEFAFVRKDGTHFPVEAHTRQVSYQGKCIQQTAIRDLTLLKRTEQERADHDRLQGVIEMAATVCHELNQPLTAIYGYLDLLEMQLPAGKGFQGKVEHVMDQVQRIETITKKLMHITQYRTKPYPGGEHIIDIDEAASDWTSP